MENVKKFIESNPFLEFKVGECGFGRKCVGIMNKTTECWLSYREYDRDTFDVVSENKAAVENAPEHAYHKSPLLCVLLADIDEHEGVEELDGWIGNIIAEPYKIEDFLETGTVSALMKGGAITQKVLVSYA